MDASASTAEKVAGLLQNLHVDSHTSIRDTLQVPPNPNAGPPGGVLDSSGAGLAGGSSMPSDYREMETSMYYPSNGYMPHHGYYVGGYDHAMGEWDNYLRHVNVEGVEPQGQGAFNENGPLLYHPSGFAYHPQHMFAPYPSVTPRRGDGQSYNSSPGNQPVGNIYQQSGHSNNSFTPFSTSTNVGAFKKSQGESSSKRSSSVGAINNNGHSDARPGHTELGSGPCGRGILPVNVRTLGLPDTRAGYEGNRIGTSWLDSHKVAEGHQRHGSSSLSISGQYGRPFAPLLPNVPSGQMYRPFISAATHAGTLGRGFEPPVRRYSGTANSTQIDFIGGLQPRGNGHHWYELDKGKSWSGGIATPNSGSRHWDTFDEQDKGPRTGRGRHQRANPGATRISGSQGPTNDMQEAMSLSVNKDQFNHPDFLTVHASAKFFIIKSYSEDDIHKSIKYSTWASTVNGNKKLDLAYREAQASAKPCPLFLFFSVNASGQFCGVAEMIGPVDFNCCLDFWQQDKWTGKLPVKWHIVKDVPNSQFRHIVLENNDNKPVTNSRDTQEVPLSQGSEMLNIFKTHVLKTSILDDFLFYETRQRFMQEKKARQQTHVQLQQTNRHGNILIDEKPGKNEVSQRASHNMELGQSGNHSDKLSKSPDGLARAGSFKGGAPESSLSDAP